MIIDQPQQLVGQKGQGARCRASGGARFEAPLDFTTPLSLGFLQDVEDFGSCTRFTGGTQETAGDLFLNERPVDNVDRKSTRLNSSHAKIPYAVFCLKKKTNS